jgi:SWI/SNF-related matrix-associated actin-dependent regulator 1 of chromatin subfamily A
MSALYPYQVEGSEWLAERKRAMLADDMGLGKSAQLISACDLVFAVDVLVICPASIVANWQREIEMWRVGQWTATVVSYEGMRARHEEFMAKRWSVLAVDEAHYMKSPTAKRTLAVYGDTTGIIREFEGLVDRAEYVWVATGTPQPNFPNELYTHFKALRPDLIVGPRSGRVYTHEQFNSHFCEMRPAFQGMKIVGSKNETELAVKLSRLALRRLKESVLPELPEVRFSEFVVDADLTDVDLGINPIEAKMIKVVLERDGVAGLKSAVTHLASLRRVTGLAKVKAVAEYIRMFLETTDRKIVVFAHHTEVIAALRKQRGLQGAVALTGATKIGERGEVVREFQSNPNIRVFFGQIQAAGTGNTLTAASDLLFVESSWVPAENAQAAMRIHRIGQKSLCNVRYAVLPKSVDGLVMRAVMRKSESIAKVMGEATP